MQIVVRMVVCTIYSLQEQVFLHVQNTIYFSCDKFSRVSAIDMK